jgi:hypothetical protein
MPEKSRGRKSAATGGGGTGRMEDRGPKKTVTFDVDEQMDLDERFEELTQPMYKGKRIDDPIPSPVVTPHSHYKRSSNL